MKILVCITITVILLISNPYQSERQAIMFMFIQAYALMLLCTIGYYFPTAEESF